MSEQAKSSASTGRKSIFDTVRQMLGRGFRQSEVDALDQALDGKAERASVPIIKRATNIREVGDAGIALIKSFEGCARQRTDGLIEAYPDPATGGAPWTIGWGATRKGLHGMVTRDTIWTQEQCDERLIDDLKRYAKDVARAIGDAPTTQNQFDALVSFHYNTGAIARATLTKKHKALDYQGAAGEFARWNKAGGRVLKGLVRRRAAETKLYAG